MCLWTAVPVAIGWLAWSSPALGEDQFAAATKAFSSLREARTGDQHLFILPLVGGILISSYVLVFQQLSRTQSDTDDAQLSLDASSERTFMGIQLAIVLVLAVIASSWMAIPPKDQSIDWVVTATGLTLGYLASSLARLVMSDHIRALQWTTAQWEAWAQDKARRALSLRGMGTESFGFRSVVGMTAYIFIPLSLFSVALAAAFEANVLQVWNAYAFVPGGFVAFHFFLASNSRVSGKWVLLVVWRLLVVPGWLAMCWAMIAAGGDGLLICTIWLGCLWYSIRAVSNRYGAEMDLRNLGFSTSKASEAV